MASIIYTPKDIFDQDFKVGVRGYSTVEVDEFLDDVINSAIAVCNQNEQGYVMANYDVLAMIQAADALQNTDTSVTFSLTR